MFCTKCGKELPDGSLFCTGCGNKMVAAPAQPVQEVQPAAPVQQPMQAGYVPQQPVQPGYTPNMQPYQAAQPTPGMQPMPGAQPVQPTQPKPKKKVPVGLIIGLSCGGAAVILLAVAAIWFFVLRPVKIDLNPYVEVKSEGYDTIGKADVVFDRGAFETEYGEQIRKKYKGDKSLDPVDEFCNDIVKYSLSKNTGLSNGDTVSFTWDCDEFIAKDTYNCKLEYSDFDYEVTNLKEAELFDPFQYIDLTFSGTAPRGSINLKTDDSEELIKYMDFKYETSNGDEFHLNNGDTVTVKASCFQGEDWLLEQYGCIVEPSEKTYTVENLPKYLSSLSEVPSDVVEKVNEAIYANYQKNFNSHRELVKEVEPLGMVVMYNKDANSWTEMNKVYFLYKVTIQPTKGAAFEGYTGIRYADVIVDDSGSVNINSNQLSFFGNQNNFDGGWYRGFDSLEGIYEAITNPDSADYNMETTVDFTFEEEE